MDWLPRVSETNTASHVSCLSIKISSKRKKTKPNPKFPLPRPPRVPLERPGSRRGGRELGGRSRPAPGPERPSEVGRDEVRRPCRRRGALAGSRSGSVPLTFAPVVGRHLAAAFISSLPSGAPATAPRGGIWPPCPGRRRGRPASPAESSRWCRGDGASPVRRRLEVQVSEGVTAARPPCCPVASTGARPCPSARGGTLRGRDAPARRPARPARGRACPASALPCRSHFVFSAPRPAPEAARRPGAARDGPARAPRARPRSFPRACRRTPLRGNFHPSPDRETLTVRRPRVWPGRESPAGVRARGGRCRRTRLSGVPFRRRGPGPGPAGRHVEGEVDRDGGTRGSRSVRLDFSSPRFPVPRDRAAGPVGVGRRRPVRRRRLGGTFPLTPPPRVPVRRRGGSWRPLPAPATVAVGSISSPRPPRLSSGLPGFGGRPGGPAAPPASGDGVVTGVRWPETGSEEAAEVRG